MTKIFIISLPLNLFFRIVKVRLLLCQYKIYEIFNSSAMDYIVGENWMKKFLGYGEHLAAEIIGRTEFLESIWEKKV